MTQNTKQNIIDKSGINALRTLIESKGSIFHEKQGKNDIGFDASIEFCKKEGEKYPATGIEIQIQVKSGKSYFNMNNSFIKGDKAHFEYWHNFITPAFGITYNSETRNLYWVNMTEYLLKTKNITSFNIPVPNKNILNETTYDDFMENCIQYCLQDKKRINIGEKLESLYSDDIEIASSSLKNLFLHERNSRLFWLTILNYIYTCKNDVLLEGIVYYLAIAIGHQYDLWWHKDNEISTEISDWLKIEFNKIVDNKILYKILSVVDEDAGLTRGTIGGLLVPFMKEVNRKNLLLDIIFNDKNRLFIRDIALTFYLTELNKEEGLKFIEQQLANIHNEKLPLNMDTPDLIGLEDTLAMGKQAFLEYGEIGLV